MYRRVAQNLKKFDMIPSSVSIFDYIKDKDNTHEWYYSPILYTQKQYQEFKKTNSVSGMRDVMTDQLWWDFDCKDQEKARQSTIETTKRLLSKGFKEENLQIKFSGNKGFHILVDTDKKMTNKEALAICQKIAGDLEGFDDSVYLPSQLLRLPLTKNKKSNLYSIPLTYNDLKDNNMDWIKTQAKKVEHFNEELKDLKNFYERIKLPKEVYDYKDLAPVVNIAPVEDDLEFDLTTIEFSKKEPGFDNARWALFHGLFRGSGTKQVGERNPALLCLAATYKNKGYTKHHTYRLLKGVAQLQSERTGEERFPDKELWNNIIGQVYSDTWQGGQYSVKDPTSWLYKYAKEYNIPPDIDRLDENYVLDITDSFSAFKTYAKHIDENTVKFGIKALDDLLRVQTGHLIGVLAPPGAGKCHGKGTEILMSDGSIKKVEDIIVGEKLMGDDSKPREVLSLARGKEKLYKIHTDDDSYIVNESHILSLKCSSEGLGRGYKKGDVINIPVKEYLNETEDFKKRTMGYRVPIEFEEREVQIDPYLVGSWLGDGTFTKPELTHNDLSLCAVYEEIAKKHNLTYRLRENPNRAYTHIFKRKNAKSPNIFRMYIKEVLNKKGTKYIPEEYLLNTKEIRQELLAGILDTDGYYEPNGSSYEVTFKEKELAENVRFLCRSLGIKCTMKKVTKEITSINFEGEYYRLYIVGKELENVPCKLERKIYKHKPKQRNPLFYRLKVEELDVGDYYGFEIDGNHLYCLADCTVTHNTSMGLTLLNNTSKDGIHSFFASYDMAQNILIQKLVQRETGYSSEELYDFFRNNDQDVIDEMLDKLQENYSNVTFNFKSGQTVEQLKLDIINTERRTGQVCKLVVVDYLELIRTQTTDPTTSSAEAIQGLREIANDGRVVVVLLQPNKMSSKIDEPLRSYNGAKGSSAIAQAVTAMITCHRPGCSSEFPERDKFFSIDIVKNRMGALGCADFSWDGPTGRIKDLDPIAKVHLEKLREQKRVEKEAEKGNEF